MAEILFYHLTATPLERTLPGLLEKSLERGWRVLVRCGSDATLEMLDKLLWTYRDDAFLPHGTGTAHADRQPVHLTTGAENMNGANILMLVDGAPVTPEELAGFDRTCLLFDGADEAAVAAARVHWRRVSATGQRAVYWAQENGRWVQKATN